MERVALRRWFRAAGMCDKIDWQETPSAIGVMMGEVVKVWGILKLNDIIARAHERVLCIREGKRAPDFLLPPEDCYEHDGYST